METTIVLLLFILLVMNPALSISYFTGFGIMPKDSKELYRIRMVKVVQCINAVFSIALFILVQILFNNLALGATINW